MRMIRRSQRLFLVVPALLATASLAACGGGSQAAAEDRPSVVAAFYPLAFAAQRIAGDELEVRNLTPPGAEPHDHELSARDVEAVRSADYVFYLGSGFQPALEDAVEGADGQTVDVLENLAVHRATDSDDDLSFDPHVWLDPVRFAKIAGRIGDALGRPERAAELAAEIRRLDSEYRQGLENCERRELVTSHAAFGYLAQRYGLEQIPITGLSPEAEPTAQDLERIVSDVEASGATTVFFETLVSPRLAETIARETGARTAELNPIEGLSEAELERGENYLSVMRANLGALRQALGCR
jgi:zinc transport system substrate-binding protein